MNLKQFIKELEDIANKNPARGEAEVTMADYIPVVKPKFKNGIVFISDMKNKNSNYSPIHPKK
ncbi:MAG: hypothetical protein Q8L47_00320 [bacterium]|nr:hypothetical protein [bacterium]